MHVVSDPESAAVLLEPVRQRLLGELQQPASAAELSRRLGEPRQKINYHLRELERVGLIELVDERRRGNCVERTVRAVAGAYVISPDVLGSMKEQSGGPFDPADPAALVAIGAESVREGARFLDQPGALGAFASTRAAQRTIRVASAERLALMAAELEVALEAIRQKYHDDRAASGHGARIHLLMHPTHVDAPYSIDVSHQVKLNAPAMACEPAVGPDPLPTQAATTEQASTRRPSDFLKRGG